MRKPLLILVLLGGLTAALSSCGSITGSNSTNTTASTGTTAEAIESEMLVYDGHVYQLYNDADSWEQAEKICESRDAHLAVINSADENNALYDYIIQQGQKNVYFGFSYNKEESIWQWITGDSTDYTNWSEDEPGDEDYAMFYEQYTKGQWDDGSFYSGDVYLCEWDNFGESSDDKKESTTGTTQKESEETTASTRSSSSTTAASSGAALSESELLSIIESTSGHIMIGSIYIDMDQDGAEEMIAAYQGSNDVFEAWYCSSDGMTCSKVHDSSEDMEECELVSVEVDGEIHIGINVYRNEGTGGDFSILALHDGEIKELVSNETGYLYITDDGDIAVSIQAYDAVYDSSTDIYSGHSYKSTYIFYDGTQYKEYGAVRLTDEAMGEYENFDTIKAAIEKERIDYLGSTPGYVYYFRANGILQIQADISIEDGISYGYYTVKYEGNVLDTNFEEVTPGKMDYYLTQLPVEYPDIDEDSTESTAIDFSGRHTE